MVKGTHMFYRYWENIIILKFSVKYKHGFKKYGYPVTYSLSNPWGELVAC